MKDVTQKEFKISKKIVEFATTPTKRKRKTSGGFEEKITKDMEDRRRMRDIIQDIVQDFEKGFGKIKLLIYVYLQKY